MDDATHDRGPPQVSYRVVFEVDSRFAGRHLEVVWFDNLRQMVEGRRQGESLAVKCLSVRKYAILPEEIPSEVADG